MQLQWRQVQQTKGLVEAGRALPANPYCPGLGVQLYRVPTIIPMTFLHKSTACVQIDGEGSHLLWAKQHGRYACILLDMRHICMGMSI